MAKDYKHRIPAYRQRKPRAARTLRLAGVAAAGLSAIIALGLYVAADPEGQSTAPAAGLEAAPPPSKSPEASDSPASKETQRAPAKDKAFSERKPQRAPAPPEPRFSFYKILPEKEVIIPENEIKIMKREESLGKKPETTYLLQAGSFTLQQDAERLKARLAEIKVKAKLEMIKLDNTAWYRVKIGPYATLADADKVRQYLRANKIDSVVQKATK